MKLNYLTIIFLVLFNSSYAQIVDIPDANFKDALLNHNPPIDTNNDGEIQVSEAEVVISLNVEIRAINSLEGIQSFINIEILNISYNYSLPSLNISQNTKLKELYCQFCQISNIDATQNPDLEILDCWENEITSIDVTQNSKLLELWCNSNQLSDIDITQNPNLISLWIQGNQLNNLNLTQNPNLEDLRCEGNQLTSLDITQNPNLITVHCEENQINSIDVSQNPNLWLFSCSGNQLTTLSFTQNTNLNRFWCGNNQITSIDVTQNALLLVMYCENNLITDIDVSQNPNLEFLKCDQNNLISLNVQNGNNTIIKKLDATNNPDLFCVQVDDINYANDQECDTSLPFLGWCKDETAIYSEDCILGIEDKTTFKYTLYPNPVQNILRFYNSSNTGITSVKLLDVLGRLVMEEKGDVNQIDVSHLNSGLFLVIIETDEGVLTKKIIKE